LCGLTGNGGKNRLSCYWRKKEFYFAVSGIYLAKDCIKSHYNKAKIAQLYEGGYLMDE